MTPPSNRLPVLSLRVPKGGCWSYGLEQMLNNWPFFEMRGGLFTTAPNGCQSLAQESGYDSASGRDD
jgi:hypothetical protein